MNTYLLFPEGKEKALTLSYDDGVDTDIRFIELLEKFNIKCTFNINSGCFSPEGSVRPESQVHFRLSESEVKNVYDNPLCEVATHGFTHPFLNHQPTAHCMLEILKDRQTLEKLFGRIIRGHAFPFGTYNDDVVDILKQAGIVYARTTESHHSFKIPSDWLRMGATCHHDDPELMNLAEKFINGNVVNNDGWLFYLWGHTFEFRKNNNWNVIEEFFTKTANNNNVWYATNIEIYDYITAYRNLVYSVDGNMIYNPTSTDIWVKINGKKINIPSGKTFKIKGERYERI
ncbi:MAG: polysaccharide deacetylase family protein [Acutalibacteraceae bacterium]|nr:polysaccharide deacetylase family protein [Acutalibacteraceae bacterium]